MATAAGDKVMRRFGGRRQQSATPAEIGATLRDARETAGVTLDEVRDRTGMPLHQLAALEAGDTAQFPDLRSALTAVRRYADLMDLDADELGAVVRDTWGSGHAASAEDSPPPKRRRRKGAQNGRSAPVPEAPAAGGHLSRYPGDGSHLRAFTTTAEVPGVQRTVVSAGTPQGTPATFSVTGVFPAAGVWVVPDRRIPLVLSGAIWVTVALLVVALGGLAVQHWEPKWLTAIHVVRSPTTTTKPAAAGSGGSGSHPSTPPPGAVTQTSIGNGTAAISVQATNFSVVVGASGACWVQASTPQSFTPTFRQTLEAGQHATLQSADGQLTVQVGSSFALLAVDINGKPARGWLFKPPSAPFTLNFTSSS
ncbi:MAG: helix-turn-helix transcriptional regulator [Acidimicrobiales bacterium]